MSLCRQPTVYSPQSTWIGQSNVDHGLWTVDRGLLKRYHQAVHADWPWYDAHSVADVLDAFVNNLIA